LSGAARVAAPDETARKVIHILYGFAAPSLRFLPWWGAATLAAAFALHNRWLLPRWGARLLRPGERWPGGGVHLYPLAVLAAVLVFAARPELAASVWGVLAFGDGLAALVGRAVRGPRLPWNGAKTWAGTATYLLAGGAAAAALTWFVSGTSSHGAMTFASACAPAAFAAAAAAAVESLRTRADDNATAALAAMLALGMWTAMEPALLIERGPVVLARVLPALVVNGVAALLAARAGAVTSAGAMAGFVLASATWLSGGTSLWALFALFFVLGTAATRFGAGVKRARRVAEPRQGRRGAVQAFANTGVPAALAALSLAAREPGPFLLAAAAGFATAAMDTVSSEVGQVLGRRPVLLGTRRRVPIGTEGGVSIEGTAAGAAAAVTVAALGGALGLYAPGWVAVVAGVAVAGGLVESAVARVLAQLGPVDNEAMNLLNTAVGSGLCLMVALLLRAPLD
jgi:uncharacterized protein (TIGR00297 family)